jgi:hypothetical protein
MGKKLQIIIATVFSLAMLAACGEDNEYSNNEDEIEIPLGAFPIVDKTFQFAWSGAYNQSKQSFGYTGDAACENYTVNVGSSVKETYYNGMHNDTVIITYNNVAVNATCESASGVASGGDIVSQGFVLFNKKTATTYPYLGLSGSEKKEFFNYVSVVRFSLSTTSVKGSGLSLYKSINRGADELVSNFMPQEINKGEYFSVAINSSNVNFKFAPAADNEGYIRMHDLQIYSEGVPTGAQILADESFNNTANWPLAGYQSVPSQIPYIDYVPENPESDSNLKGITFIPAAMYNPMTDITKSVTYSSGLAINYTIKDGAVNPYCYNHHGNLTLVYGLTKGYVDLPVQKADYPRKDIDAFLTISEFPSVSLAEFWLSTDSMDCNHEIYYKTKDDADYKLLTKFVYDKYTGIGKYIRVWVNAENVSFRIEPGVGSKNGTGTLYNGKYVGIERKTKVHGIRIWSK